MRLYLCDAPISKSAGTYGIRLKICIYPPVCENDYPQHAGRSVKTTIITADMFIFELLLI